jgi:hypothetical protein
MEKERGRVGQGLVKSRPDGAGRSFCEAFAEPRVLGTVALCFTDGILTAPCQEGSSGSFPLFDC